MPQKHQSAKSHKAIVIGAEHFNEILCFSALVAKRTFQSRLLFRKQITNILWFD